MKLSFLFRDSCVPRRSRYKHLFDLIDRSIAFSNNKKRTLDAIQRLGTQGSWYLYFRVRFSPIPEFLPVSTVYQALSNLITNFDCDLVFGSACKKGYFYIFWSFKSSRKKYFLLSRMIMNVHSRLFVNDYE